MAKHLILVCLLCCVAGILSAQKEYPKAATARWALELAYNDFHPRPERSLDDYPNVRPEWETNPILNQEKIWNDTSKLLIQAYEYESKLHSRDIKKAIEKCNEAIQTNEYNLQAYYLRASLKYRLYMQKSSFPREERRKNLTEAKKDFDFVYSVRKSLFLHIIVLSANVSLRIGELSNNIDVAKLNYIEAISKYETYISLSDASSIQRRMICADAYINIGICYAYQASGSAAMQYYDKAIASVDKALQYGMNKAFALRTLGWLKTDRTLLGDNMYQKTVPLWEGISDFESAQKLASDLQNDIKQGIAYNYYLQGNINEDNRQSYELYKKSISTYEKSSITSEYPIEYSIFASAHYQLGALTNDNATKSIYITKAKDMADELLGHYPNNVRFQALKNWCLFSLDSIDAALSLALSMNSSVEKNYDRCELIAYCYAKKLDFPKAIEYINIAISQKPSGHLFSENARYSHNLFDAENCLLNFQKAEQYSSYENLPWIKAKVAWCYYWLKNYEMARAYFNKALELDKKNAEATLGLGWLEMKLNGNLSLANEHISNAKNLGYDESAIQWSMGYLYALKRNFTEAELELNKSIEKLHSHPRVYNTLAHVYELQGKHAEAKKAYEKSLELGGEYYKPEFVIKERNQSMAVTKSGEPIVKPQVSSNTFKKGQRIAFVVNNSYYNMADGYDTLMATQRDAVSIRQAFKNMGYEVLYASDKNRDSLIIELKAFQNKLAKGTYETAVFYYSGHGVRHGDHSYIVPLNAKSGAFPEDLVSFEKIKRDYMVKVKNKIIIADACRVTENGPSLSLPQTSLSLPQKGGITSKTTGEDNPENLQNAEVIWYATSQNAYAHTTADKSESIFTKALLKHMSSIINFWTLKASVDTEMNNIIAEEYKKTNGEAYQQTEAKDGKGLLGFYLAPR